MAIPELQYAAVATARTVLVQQDDGVTRIIVPIRGLYAPIPPWIGDLDLFALVIAPVWWLATLTIRSCLRLPKPPRAVFEVSEDRFKMCLLDVATGQTREFDWPRSAIAEVRANRYERGLWINVPGHLIESCLTDLPRDSIERLEAALKAALGRGNEGTESAVNSLSS